MVIHREALLQLGRKTPGRYGGVVSSQGLPGGVVHQLPADLGHALAAAMGAHSVMLMRGHGSVAAAQSIRHVVFRAVYTEVNARVQAEAMKLGTPMFLNAEEAAAAARTNDALVDRPWALWRQRAMGR